MSRRGICAALLTLLTGGMSDAATPSLDARLGAESPVVPYDPKLKLATVVEATFDHYPRQALIMASEDEAKALQTRSTSWIAGFPMIYLQWIDDTILSGDGLLEIQTGYQIPVWMWGQKDAGQKVADEASRSVLAFSVAVKHEVAGLVRDALWNIKLAENRYELARQVYEVSTKLVATVARRVELGDLSRSDLLMAESDSLEKKTLVGQAELELIKSYQVYTNVTRLQQVPRDFGETQSNIKDIAENHPSLAALNTMIERAQAQVEWTRRSKQGNQPSILLGTNHARTFRGEALNSGTNIVLQIPVGGDDWNSPAVAEANVALNQKIVEREMLMRELNKALAATRRSIETNRSLLEIAERRREIAETQIRMNQLAFESGEIELINFLKIQSTAQMTIRDARERGILLEKDLALYNQVVGVTP
ncbi:MAG: TolC family protein [Methylotetracoccus sp.]